MTTHLARSLIVIFALAGTAAAQILPPTVTPNPTNFAKAALYSARSDGVAMLVALNGVTVFEDYPSLYHTTGPDIAWFIASGTKGFWGPVCAAMIADGLISSYDEKASVTITEWQNDATYPAKKDITIRHLLQLISGLDANYLGETPLPFSVAITAPLDFAPGTTFEYGHVPYSVFGEIVRRKLIAAGIGLPVPDPVEHYLEPRILARIGTAPADWKRTANGDPHMSSGASFTLRTWLPYGELLRRGGTWTNGDVVIPQSILDECFVGSSVRPAYGITWWLDAGSATPATGDLASVLGAGGQNLYFSRSRGFTVLRQTSATGNASDEARARQVLFEDNEFLSLVWTGQLQKPDADGDLIPDALDVFPAHPNDWVDSDLDGLGDDFERRMWTFSTTDSLTGLSTVLPDADYDGDGVSNLNEFLNQTDPLQAEVLNVAAFPGNGRVLVNWALPPVASFDRVRVQRSVTGFPASISDGASLYEGNAQQHVLDTGLTNDVPHYYTVFTRSTAGVWSSGIRVSATPRGPSTQMLTFTAVEDALVTQNPPTSNFGGQTYLRVKASASSAIESLLKFNLTGLQNVQSATLRLRTLTTPVTQLNVQAVADSSWSESTLTWNNKPALGATLATGASLAVSTSHDFAVTPHVTGNGAVSFGLSSTATTVSQDFSSREGANAPQLLVTQNLAAPNLPPIVSSTRTLVERDTTREITFTYVDVDGGIGAPVITASAAHGTVTQVGGVWTYTPFGSFTGMDVITFQVNDGISTSIGGTVLVEVSEAGPSGLNKPHNLQFSLDFLSGGTDTNGVFMAGTEIMALESHQGMLFAGTGMWNWDESQSLHGSQVLVKPSATAPWRADGSFPNSYGRISCLLSVTFTNDINGNTLNPPVSILLGGVARSGAAGRSFVISRADQPDGTGTWTTMMVSDKLADYTSGYAFSETRALYDHQDSVTGVHHVFATLTAGSSQEGSYIVRGAYDPTAPGRIRWATTPDATGPDGTGFARRGLAGTEAAGSVYATINVNPDAPGKGGLWRRVDGLLTPTTQWQLVYEWPLPPGFTDSRRSGMRGLTMVPSLTGAGQALLGGREIPGVIERIEPSQNHAVVQELDVKEMLRLNWDGISGLIINYDNNMVPWTHPDTGEPLTVIPLGAGHPDRPSMDYAALSTINGDSSWYLIRDSAARYTLGRIFDPLNPAPIPLFGLRSARTACVSPFPEDRGRVVFFGGFDAGGSDVLVYTNTAWIMRGELPPERPALEITAGPPAPQLHLRGAYGLPYQIESSTDLIQWQPLFEATMSAANETMDLPPLTESRRFYRLRSLP